MSTCRSDDLSDQEGEAAAASESHSPRSKEAGSGSESSSGSDTSSASELVDLKDEQEALQSMDMDVTAPRGKRRRASSSSPHHADLLEQRNRTSGRNACKRRSVSDMLSQYNAVLKICNRL